MKSITFEVSRVGDSYEVWAHNESKSVSRSFGHLGNERLTNILGATAIELLGDVDKDEDEKVALIEANEEAINEAFMEDYHGSKDNWESALWAWEENLTLEDVKKILA